MSGINVTLDSFQQMLSRRYLTHLFFNYHGRMSRQHYLLNVLLLVALVTLSLFPFALFGLFMRAIEFPMLSELAFFIPMFFACYAFGVLTIKRLHDMSLTGWWGLAGFIPLLGTLPMTILLLFIRGTEGDNRYGRDPSL